MEQRVEAYSIEGLEQLVAQLGQPKFRATQLLEWLYGKGVHSYAEMTNLPAALRSELETCAPFTFPTIVDKQVSADGTRKYVLQLACGNLVETVGIPSTEADDEAGSKRLTVCFSTQVGCPMRCDFCATGREGFTRNLLPGEMVWQILAVAQDFGQRVSNVVAMGQGEPFLNYQNTLDALRIINHSKACGIGARHITVSTCGILEGIRSFGHESEQFVLAISLHSAIQEKRDRLMPGCKSTSLAELHEALEDYQQHSKRRITFEHLLIEGVNSENDDLQALISYCQGLSAHVNLLPINAVEGSNYQPCTSAKMNSWATQLNNAGINASVRTSRGGDISGACGQLKNARVNTRA